MNRFAPLVAIVLAFAAVSPSSLSAEPLLAGEKPNVILIYADDLGYGDLSCYGATKVKTPHVDRLAENGIKFTRAHCTAATCTPSRYSILTGQYAWRKPGTGILPGDAAMIIPTDRATLGKVFQQAGYKTACVGKWHLGMGPEGGPDWNGEIKPSPNEVGFDYSFVFPATADRVPTVYVRDHHVVGLDPNDKIRVDYEEKVGSDHTGKENPELLKMKASPGQGHDGTIVNGIGRIGFMEGGNQARWTDESLAGDFTDEAVQFIERNREQPFFMYFALSNIHVPRMPDTRFKGKSGLGYRGDSILEMDHIVGRVMNSLDQLGLTTNTMVIFTSDNGPVLDDGYQDGAVDQLNGHTPLGPLRGGKYSILEGGTRVPFIVSWPARVQKGESDALLSQVDFVGSFASMLGQKLGGDDAPDSRDVSAALISAEADGAPDLVEEAGALALVKGDWKYIEPKEGPAFLKKVGIESGRSEAPQLYNLKDDLAEKHNLALERPELVRQMAEELNRIKKSEKTR